MNRRREESGFALLLVFLMAASIAIMLYSQMPRAAFESQRMKEEILIERGEQYIRAIQLYTAEWRTYPQSLDQLEKTNNKRYLRRRYKDPMTGEDEWRLLHINAAGVLTDSKIKKKDEKKQNQNSFITEMAGIGVTQSPDKAGVNVALRRRPSDGGMEAAPGAYPNGPGMPPGAPGAPAGAQPPPYGAPPVPGQMPPGQGPQANSAQSQQPISQDPEKEPSQQAGLPGQLGYQGAPPGAVQPGYTQPVVPNSPQPGQPMQQGYPSPAGQQQYPGPQPAIGQQPYPAQPGAQPGYPQGQAQQGRPGQPVPGQPGNPALQMIQNILTSPRPEMANNSNMQVPGAPGLTIGGGIAGVASKAEMKSIKVYNERERYDEWEFVYDVRKDKRLKQQVGQFGQGLGGQQLPNAQGQGMGMMNGGAPGFSQQPAQTVPLQPGSPQPASPQPGSPQPAPSGGYPSPSGIGR